ncbi:helix-turn-helix transcriptional regulator [Paenarthrobacter nicotinovorans]|uniref:Helix-turn-helix transcriptional regulator n=1 Tax=Paenarthrobacter nicotinovorans TaxID=29320 RepID=A0ABV0GTU8_PAENI
MNDESPEGAGGGLEPALLVAARLREARDVTGLTQGDVALALGIARTSVAAFESGVRKVSAVEIRALATLYGRTVGWLIGEEESPDLSGQALYRATNSLSQKDRDQVLKFAQFLASSAANDGSPDGQHRTGHA